MDYAFFGNFWYYAFYYRYLLLSRIIYENNWEEDIVEDQRYR
jgi:hypothetical protein